MPADVLRALALLLPTTLAVWSFVPKATASYAPPPPSVPTESAPEAWQPPPWFPEPAALDVLEGVAASGPHQGPPLRSRAVFVYDVDADRVLYERRADDARPVASLTKLVSSLAMASEQPDLDVVRCVSPDLWPSRSGARSKLSTGECYRGWDYLGAALVSSDNRGAYGIQAVSGLTYRAFVARMDEVSRDLGMADSSWADPSGLEDNNLSTARDLTRAVLAVAAHPVLSIAATAREWNLDTVDGKHRVLGTTNHLADRKDLEILAAKTGYTDTAGYCFSAVVRTSTGRTLALTLLGAPSTSARWADARRLIDWAG